MPVLDATILAVGNFWPVFTLLVLALAWAARV